ncbi:MAG: mechanosensitive ion channel family protein [Spirochaetes bacterium]|jgi:small-conductance mechanosensitive channel|nr:mechanosensitive ion channel family protein [Spirochaetota bacterium]
MKIEEYLQELLSDTIFSSITELELLGLNIFNLVLFAAIFVLLLFVFTVIRKIALYRISVLAERSTSPLKGAIAQIFRDVNYLFFVVFSFYIASYLVNIGGPFNKIVHYVFVIVLGFNIIIFIQNIAIYAIHSYWGAEDPEENENATVVNAISLFMRIALWVVGLIILLSNLGVEISALVASLGISSIAIAFALQNILSDVFSSFSIYLDRPFEVGDFIIVGDDNGIVKKVGIKSTRIQTLQGQLLVISNHELTSVRINNYKQMESRRVVFSIGVIYGTPVEKLRKIPQIVKDIIDAQDLATFDRTHFSEIGSHSLNFEIVYYVNSADYLVYRDTHQSVCLGIYETFESEELEFAFPTQTLLVQNT